jgi:hypothetical protein
MKGSHGGSHTLREAKLLATSFDGVESIEAVSCDYSFSLYVIRNCFFERFGKARNQTDKKMFLNDSKNQLQISKS